MMLEAKGIYRSYNNGKKNLEVLKGADLNIEKGKFIAIVGPSGAGKSTLLHILGGLDAPDAGKVIFEDNDIYSLSDGSISKIRNKKIGFVFQFYNLLSEFTVLENVFMPGIINKKTQAEEKEVKKEALKILHDVGLSERTEHFPNQLSGGEKQRVAIARALLNKPSLFLCDEPTGNLDSHTGSEIISLIKKINLESQMTVCLVTHNLELTKTANKVYRLIDGILVN